MSSYEVVQRGAAAGIVITASHNPWVDNGFKVKAPTGAAAGADILGVIESQLAVNGGIGIARRAFADGEAAGLVERFDPFEGYEQFVRRTVDLDALKAADVSVLVDPMWGAGSGWLSRLLSGGRIRVTEIHQERNPFFGGVNPEPIRPNIDEALALLAAGSFDLGLFLDGDADRAGAADEHGTFVHQLQVTGLLMYYLAEHRGWRDPVVVSVNNTSMAARLGEHYGIQTHETPVGFKFIGPKMIETGAMMGAEESGGFGFGMHLPERDGIYADLLLLDLFLRERAARAMAGLARDRVVPRDRRAVVLPPDRRPFRPARLCRGQAPAAGRPSRAGAGGAGRTARDPDDAARHGRRLQVLGGGRLVAPRPRVRHRAAGPGLHGGDLRGHARGHARGRRAAGSGGMSGDLPAGGRRVDKPWGHELIWAHTDRYVGKVLVIEAGKRLSLQRHLVKDESILVSAGLLRLHLEDDEGTLCIEELGPGEHRHVPTGRVHRYEAIERCTLIEVSTPELDDVVRLEDDFGREGTSAP